MSTKAATDAETTRLLSSKQRWFEDAALQMNTSARNGKTILSTENAAIICEKIAELIKIIKEK